MGMEAISASLHPTSIRLLERGRCCSSALSFSLPLVAPQISSTFKPKCPTRVSVIRTYCSNRQGFDADRNDSKAVLDAFFLGKAMAEAVTERMEATVGEFFSVIGRWQAEQSKQVQDLQEEVFTRATRAKQKAAREALVEKGIIPSSTATKPDAGTPEGPPSAIVPSPAAPLTSIPVTGDDMSNDPFSDSWEE